jgi:hypothetical protein
MQRRIMHGPTGFPGVLFGLPVTRRWVNQLLALGLRPAHRVVTGPHPEPRRRLVGAAAARSAL